tara:strand:+ start:41 stop:379 length:339 start_codon:yes stop_codon:yes gene_type:complete
VIPTGIVFITIERVNIQPIIVIAVIKLGTNNVKPFALFAKLFAAVPNMTASIRIRKATRLLTNKRYSYLVILSTNFLIGGPTRRAAIIAIGRLTDHALKKRSTYSLSIPVFI